MSIAINQLLNGQHTLVCHSVANGQVVVPLRVRRGERVEAAIARVWHTVPTWAKHSGRQLRFTPPTLAEWLDVWFELRYFELIYEPKRPSKATVAMVSGCIKFWTRELGDTRVDHIEGPDISAALARSRVAQNTKAKYFKRLNTAYNDLVRNGFAGWRPGLNPCNQVRVREDTSGSYDRLTRDEIPVFLRAFDAAADHDSRVFVRLCLYAGLRAGEAQSIRWSWVDTGEQWRPAAGVIRFPAASVKERRGKHVPFGKSLGSVLPERGDVTSLVVKPNPAGLEAGLRAAANALGRRITPHCLRVTYANVMHYECGATAKEVQELLGHADLTTTLRYLRSPESDLVQRMAFDYFSRAEAAL